MLTWITLGMIEENQENPEWESARLRARSEFDISVDLLLDYFAAFVSPKGILYVMN